MTSVLKICLPAFILLLINGCVQPKVLQLTRVEPLQGRPTDTVALTQKDSVVVMLQYNGLSYGNLDFTLTMQNGSADTLFIGPADFSYMPKFSLPGPGGIDTPATIPAIDPTQKVAWLNEWKAKEEKATNPYNDLAFSLVTGILESVLISKKEQEKSADERRRNAEEWDKEHWQTLYYIGNQIEFWRETAMGNILVVPGRTVSGRILFTVQPEATEVRVRIRLNGDVRETIFRQEMGRR
jgi:hypothetical protein